jgi:hypothetical protein
LKTFIVFCLIILGKKVAPASTYLTPPGVRTSYHRYNRSKSANVPPLLFNWNECVFLQKILHKSSDDENSGKCFSRKKRSVLFRIEIHSRTGLLAYTIYFFIQDRKQNARKSEALIRCLYRWDSVVFKSICGIEHDRIRMKKAIWMFSLVLMSKYLSKEFAK